MRGQRKDKMTHEFKPGDKVHYHPIIGGPAKPEVYTVRELGALGDNSPVAWLDGKAGCVSLKALSLALDKSP